MAQGDIRASPPGVWIVVGSLLLLHGLVMLVTGKMCSTRECRCIPKAERPKMYWLAVGATGVFGVGIVIVGVVFMLEEQDDDEAPPPTPAPT